MRRFSKRKEKDFGCQIKMGKMVLVGRPHSNKELHSLRTGKSLQRGPKVNRTYSCTLKNDFSLKIPYFDWRKKCIKYIICHWPFFLLGNVSKIKQISRYNSIFVWGKMAMVGPEIRHKLWQFWAELRSDLAILEALIFFCPPIYCFILPQVVCFQYFPPGPIVGPKIGRELSWHPSKLHFYPTLKIWTLMGLFRFFYFVPWQYFWTGATTKDSLESLF